MANIYDRLGVRTIINASGPSTRLSGSHHAAEVAEAMREASQLLRRHRGAAGAGGRDHRGDHGAEAGYVTSGAAAGLLLGTAACVTGLHPGKMNRLPDTAGMKDEVIIPRSQRNFYDHAVRAVGIKLIDVGLADRFGRGCPRHRGLEIADAISPIPRRSTTSPIATRCRRCRRSSACARAGRSRDRGCRRAASSGEQSAALHRRGRRPGGVQRRQSDPRPAELGDPLRPARPDLGRGAPAPRPRHPLRAVEPAPVADRQEPPAGRPSHGIGRPCKVGKEEIVGLITALQLFVSEDAEARRQRWLGLDADARRRPGRSSSRARHPGWWKRTRGPDGASGAGRERALGLTALEVVKRLQDGTPEHPRQSLAGAGWVVGFRAAVFEGGGAGDHWAAGAGGVGGEVSFAG